MRTYPNFYSHSNSYLYSNSYPYEYAHASSTNAIFYSHSYTSHDSR
jgi:hypothetical protein